MQRSLMYLCVLMVSATTNIAVFFHNFFRYSELVMIQEHYFIK